MSSSPGPNVLRNQERKAMAGETEESMFQRGSVVVALGDESSSMYRAGSEIPFRENGRGHLTVKVDTRGEYAEVIRGNK